MDTKKRDALLAAATALLEASPGKTLQITNLNKALFYLDLHALLILGRTITHNTFIALKEGPVIAKYEDRLVGQLEKAGIATQQRDANKNEKPVVLCNARAAPKRLADEEVPIARRVAKWAAAKSAGWISRYAHDNAGWKLAWEKSGSGARGSNKLPIDMMIALQQLADEDPWLDEPLSPDEKAAVDAVDAGEVEPW